VTAKQTNVEAVAEPSAGVVAPVEAPAAAPVAPVAPAAPQSVCLEGSLLIRSAAELAARLREALGTGALRLDARGVTHVDTASLQLLVAAIATARRDGVAFEWLGASPALHEGARRLGLGAPLALPASG
jgi:anti-anti-sigma regulatory factor